jgi:hypothetical protein
MAKKIQCCSRPSLVRDWQNGKYGVRCTECKRFTADTDQGGRPSKPQEEK